MGSGRACHLNAYSEDWRLKYYGRRREGGLESIHQALQCVDQVLLLWASCNAIEQTIQRESLT
jgi:hypothetical protein